MFESPQNANAKSYIPKMMILDGGTFWRWLGFEGRVLMNGLAALKKKTPESSFSPSAMWGQSKKMVISELENRSSPDTNLLALDLELLSPQNCEK